MEDNCVLVFPTLTFISTNNTEIPTGRIEIGGKKEENSCSLEKFMELSKLVDDYGSAFDEADTIEDIVTLRYLCDIQTFNADWQACDQFVKTLMIPIQELVTFPKSTTCSVDMMKNASIVASDACCNETLGWSVCCVEREVQTMRTSFERLLNNHHNNSSPSSSSSSSPSPSPSPSTRSMPTGTSTRNNV